MESKETIIYEYEQILLGNAHSFNATLHSGITSRMFENVDSKTERYATLSIIWRYAIQNLLGWTPQYAVEHLTTEIIHDLCLDKTYFALSEDGQEYNIKSKIDPRVFLSLAFPEEIVYDLKEQTLEEYQQALKTGKYRAGFFKDEQASERAAILLKTVIEQEMPDYSKEELYAFFGDEKKAKSWMKLHKLGAILKNIYSTPLEYFHFSQDIDKQDKILYYNYLIKSQMDKIKYVKKNTRLKKELYCCDLQNSNITLGEWIEKMLSDFPNDFGVIVIQPAGVVWEYKQGALLEEIDNKLLMKKVRRCNYLGDYLNTDYFLETE